MKYFFIIIWILIQSKSYAQTETKVPNEIKPFILRGHEVLDFQTGDLNGDKKPDAILILKKAGEDTLQTEDYINPKRPMLLLIRQLNGKLKLQKRNDQIVMCRECGGIYGDPFSDVSIIDNSFTVHFYGGSAWRWSDAYYFTYNLPLKDWFISTESESTYWNGDPDGSFNSITIPARESGTISFEKYLRYSVEEAKLTNWKVNVAKAYFYDTAAINSKPLKTYLIKGDAIDSYRETTNFILVEYTNAKEKTTRGFIRKKDLIRQ